MKETEKSTSLLNIESNKYTLELVNGWINNADTKISIACGISSVVLAVIAFGAENILGDLAKNNGLNGYVMPLFMLAFAVACITFIVSLWYYFLALNPSLISSKSEIEKPKYSIFYKDISKFTNVLHLIFSFSNAFKISDISSISKCVEYDEETYNTEASNYLALFNTI